MLTNFVGQQSLEVDSEVELQAAEKVGRLIAEVARLWRSCLDQRLQPLGLSQAKWLVLLLLADAPSGLRQNQLAERCGVEAPTMAVLLDRMEQEGWVVRETDPGDRRCKVSLLTERARSLAATVFTEAQRLREEVLEPLSVVELQQCVTALERLRQHLQVLRNAAD